MADGAYPRSEKTPAGEPIAVIGMSCRFPGGADDPDRFWTNLEAGVHSLSPIPPERWDTERFYAEAAQTPGKTQMREGGFIAGADTFDAAFFGVTPREATHMDPQHRLALQLVWAALEDANILPAALRGSETGVFLGLGSTDYFSRFVQGPIEGLDSFTGVGNSPGVAAGRIAHILGLHGPCMVIDTTCSSALTNLHAACGALRLGECDLAIAGGVHLMFSPRLPVIGTQAGMLSPTNRCHTFDESADGFARGEGGGMVVLKRLSRAQADGDLIHGLVLGSAINHDGASFGLTVPSGPAQQRVIEKAYRASGVSIDEIGYVEAHGTGTPLGDPIEINALARVFRDRKVGRPLYVGSVKTNIGHLEAAAGAAGLIKTVLSLRAGLVTPIVGLQKQTPKVRWDKTQVTPARSLTAWPVAGRRVAGVSSFGFSGTNVHVVLAEAPKSVTPRAHRQSHLLLPLTARTASALSEQARSYSDRLRDDPGAATAERLCRTATWGRTRFAHRAAIAAHTPAGLISELDRLATGRRRGLGGAEAPKVGFVFSGQGAAYPGMGSGLMVEPVFQAEISRLSRLAEPLLDASLLDLMERQDPSILDNRLVQPAMFAIACATVRLWAAYGVMPAAVLGHSLGEIAAAAAAGMISTESALRFVIARARAIEACDAGAMAEVVGPPTEEIERLAGRHGLALAAVNAHDRAVLAGGANAIDALLRQADTGGYAAFRLNVTRAFHTALCNPALAAVEAAAAELKVALPQARFVSGLLGETLDDPAALDAAYWRKQLRQPVQFEAGLRAMRALGCDVLVDIGPHPALRGAVNTVLHGAPYIATLRRNAPDVETFAAARATLFEHGSEPFGPAPSRSAQDLGRAPTYAFDRRRFWREWEDCGGAETPPLGELMCVAWEPAPAPEHRQANSVVILGPSSTIAEGWQKRLSMRDGDVRVLADVSELASEATGQPRTLVLALAPADQSANRRAASDGAALTAWLAEVARRLQALPRAAREDLDCVVLTRGAVDAVSHDRINPAQTAVWSAVRCIRAEALALAPRLVDLPLGTLEEQLLDSLREELRQTTPEVALRGTRLTPSLVRRGVASSTPPDLRGGNVLVTGATGSLGGRVIDWLVGQGVSRLALNARNASALEAVAQRVRRAGVSCIAFIGDLADRTLCETIVAAARAEAPLSGIFHCAGVTADGSTLDIATAQIDAVFAAKAHSAEALLEAAGRELSHFVGFSSLASVLGSPGQAAYAAANGFLDGLLLERRGQARCMVSINWGPWADGGMADRLDDNARLRFERGGIGLLETDAAMARLSAALVSGEPQVIAAQADWPRYAKMAAAVQALGLRIEGGTSGAQDGSARESLRLAAALRNCAPEALAASTEAFLEALLREIGHLDGSDEIDRMAFLGELGFDSLMLLGLKGRLEADLGVSPPLALLGGQTSIQGVTDYIVEALRLARVGTADHEGEALAVL